MPYPETVSRWLIGSVAFTIFLCSSNLSAQEFVGVVTLAKQAMWTENRLLRA